MGVLPVVDLSKLIALDAGGLTHALQLIMENMREQQDSMESMQALVGEQKARLDGMVEAQNAMEEAFGSQGNECDDKDEEPSATEPPVELEPSVSTEVAGAVDSEDCAPPALCTSVGETATEGHRQSVGEASRAGSKRSSMSAMNVMNSALASVQALEGTVEALTRRLALTEQHQEEWSQRWGQAEQLRQQSSVSLSRRLDEDSQHRQSLDQSVRALEASIKLDEAKLADGNRDLEELRCSLTEEFRRSYQQFEARVRIAEEKASQCRQEAKEFREAEDTREYAITEVQSQMRKVSSTSKHALDTSDQAAEAQRDISRDALMFEAQFQELEGRLRAKASEAIVEAIRNDFETNNKVMHDAVKAVGQKLSEQEDRLRGLERAPLQRSLVQESFAPTQDRLRELESRLYGLPHTSDTGDKAQTVPDDTSHCLLCHNDRSPSPTRTVMGTDNQVYGHIVSDTPEVFCAQLGEPQVLSTIRASPTQLQNMVRPRPTPASIPRPQSAPHARLHPDVGVVPSSWEVRGRENSTTAVAVSSMKKVERRPTRDVKSNRLSDLLGVESRSLTSSKTLSRPSSAQQRPARPSSAQAVRPSSAGAANVSVPVDRSSVAAAVESQQMLSSQSLPTLDRTLDATVVLPT